MERRVILMANKASPSETLAWFARAAQARRVARMLSPWDAQLAESLLSNVKIKRERLPVASDLHVRPLCSR